MLTWEDLALDDLEGEPDWEQLMVFSDVLADEDVGLACGLRWVVLHKRWPRLAQNAIPVWRGTTGWPTHCDYDYCRVIPEQLAGGHQFTWFGNLNPNHKRNRDRFVATQTPVMTALQWLCRNFARKYHKGVYIP